MSDPKDYTVGWICAITAEYVAAQAFLDDKHDGPKVLPSADNNHYTLGRMGKHNVVIAVLPDGEYGTSSAAVVASDMRHSFPNVRIGLMVGIGGGVWSKKHDIRLGDIVVSAPRDGKGGVIQYDFGKTIQGESFHPTGFLDQPPMVLRTALNGLKAQYEVEGHQIEMAISDVFKKSPKLRKKYQRPDSTNDRLYRNNIVHPSNTMDSCSTVCGDETTNLVSRPERSEEDDNPAIHYGLIASANQLMKDAIARDKLAAEKDALCFEMEAAGLMNHFPCLVIRGICDYSDTHKNKEWQGYAAMAAAAYAKDLLNQIAPSKVVAQKAIADILASVQIEVDAIRSHVQDAKNTVNDWRLEQRREKVQRWLLPPDPSTNYNKALEQRQEGSGLWFLQTDSFVEWKTKANSFLWLHGRPGCGKTILSSIIIEHLATATPSLQPLLYFYFDFNDTDKQTLERMVQSLISQLYSKGGEGTWHELDSLHSSCDDGRRQPQGESLRKTFLRMVEKQKEVWIVLDALDECSTRKESSTEGLLLWIKHLLGSERRNVHLLVTSRQEPDIESMVKEITDKDIVPIKSGLIAGDIRTYVHTRVRQGAEFKRWQSRPKVQDEIETRITEQADGMFRWAACQLDALEKCLDYPSLQIALKSLPKTLGETYSRILRGIPSEHKRYAIRILQFLTYSERPLSIEEAVDAIAVDTEGKQYFHPDHRMPNRREITCYCSNLVVMVPKQTQLFEKDTGSMVLQLAHFSVKEYLTSGGVDHDIGQSFRPNVAQASIAKVCLAYLLHLDQDIPVDEIKQTFPFAQYSARYWISNAAVAEGKDAQLHDLIKRFFSNRGTSYRNCYSLSRPDTPWEVLHVTKAASALYYASFGGLVSVVQHLLSRGADVNAQGGYYATALGAASYQGHTPIVQLLLKKAADINSPGTHGLTPLCLAAENGHEAIVNLLVNKGANMELRDSNSRTPLSWAVANTHEAVVRLLVKKGADIQSRDYNGRTPLSWATENGHEAIVRLLVDKGADIESGDINGQRPLASAATNGHEAVVRLLLDKGADIESHNAYGQTPLAWAATSGNEAIARLLLEKGADIEGHNRSPLCCAADGGHEAMVRLLLEMGADIESKIAFGLTPLAWAAESGREGTVRLLLEMGADIESKDNDGHTPLVCAIEKGREGTVSLLLEIGADIECADKDGQTPLLLALRNSYGPIARLLLQKGANPKVEDKHGQTPLSCAVQNEHRGMLSVLELHGVS